MRTEQKIAYGVYAVILCLLAVIAILAGQVRQRTVQIQELEAQVEAAKWRYPSLVETCRHGPFPYPSWIVPLRDDDGNLILSSTDDTIWRFEDEGE